jgi:hypothetical protein
MKIFFHFFDAPVTRGRRFFPDWFLMLEKHFKSRALRHAAVALFLVPALAGCRLGAGPDDAALVSSLRFSPSAFDSFRRNTELRYSLAAPAELRIRIVARTAGGEELAVKTLAERLRATKGAHAITWLGDTSERLFAPAGTYVGVVEAGGARFETTVEVFHF